MQTCRFVVEPDSRREQYGAEKEAAVAAAAAAAVAVAVAAGWHSLVQRSIKQTDAAASTPSDHHRSRCLAVWLPALVVAVQPFNPSHGPDPPELAVAVALADREIESSASSWTRTTTAAPKPHYHPTS
jgi:hypothetical protein